MEFEFSGDFENGYCVWEGELLIAHCDAEQAAYRITMALNDSATVKQSLTAVDELKKTITHILTERDATFALMVAQREAYERLWNAKSPPIEGAPAPAEIDRLRAENARLRNALIAIAGETNISARSQFPMIACDHAYKLADAALRGVLRL